MDINCKWEEINNCCICMTELFGEIQDTENLVEDVCKKQQELFEKVKGGKLEEHTVVYLPQCKGAHLYHKECLLLQFKSSENGFIKCGVCETTYGKRMGEMPDGTMTWRLEQYSLDGYPNVGTISFNYYFADGEIIRSGRHYTGTSRRCFLPASQEGITVFKMLIECFKRRMTFLVGTSLTTG